MIRFYFAYLLNNFGRFLQSLYPAILRPKQMMELEKIGYSSKSNIEAWSRIAEEGLNQSEKYLIDNLTEKKGNFLVLRSSSGRESLYLAKIDFNVTGIEWVKELIEFANKKAKENGIEIRYIQGDIFDLEKLSERFDYIMLSTGDYSAIISRKLRIEWLKKLKNILNDNGKVFLNYIIGQPTNLEKKTHWLRKLIAFSTLGNLDCQLGDRRIGNRLALHYFSDHNEVASEAKEAGFKVIKTKLEQETSRPWIVLGVN